MSLALKESLKELLRLVVMAGVSWGLSEIAKLPQTETILIGTAVLRWLDKMLHEFGKENKSDLLIGGLTRF